MDGNLKTIDGYESGLYQLSSLEAIINNNNLFVLSAFSLNSKDEASIIVNSLYYVNNYTLKYRIWLNHAPFTDSIINDYDPTNKLENGNYLAMHYSGGLVILNENAEIIYNDLPFANSSYDNFSLAFVLPLKKKPSYYALYGNYNDNGNRNFAIVIADSLWNKVDEFVWDYGDGYNLLEDMVEGDDGNLIVYGSTRYKIDNKVVFKSYYASVHFDFLTGVEDNNNVNNEINIQPNPAIDYITINLERCATLQKCGTSVVEIYDVMGILIHSTPSASQPPLNEGNFRIDISNLAPGVYFVKIVGSNGACSIVEKFVKY